MKLRSLVQALTFRNWMANIDGHTYDGKRDFYKALGYRRELDFVQGMRLYRSRFERNEIANRIIKMLPNATWRGGAEIWEDADPNTYTAFEEAFEQLDERLKIWDTLRKGDVLSRIGPYGVLLIGAPGELDQPLLTVSGPDDIHYLTPFAADDATVEMYEADNKNPRFGLPVMYNVKRTSMTTPTSINAAVVGKRVHYSRIVHLADGLLDDRIFGEPALRCVWNRLDDLEKVVGGGAEAFWKRADQGMAFDLDITQDIDAEGQKAFQQQIEDYEHGLRRYLLTRGLKATPLGSDVANFQDPVNAIIGLICAGTGIPQRVLLGSEQGKLAAKQDRGNWDDRVADRRKAYADPLVVRPLLARLIELGALPAPAQNYEVRFPVLKELGEDEKAALATSWAGINHAMQETVVTPDEIRTRVLGLTTLEEAGIDTTTSPYAKPAGKPTNLQGKESERWAHIHAAADRFRTETPEERRRRLFRRSQGYRS